MVARDIDRRRQEILRRLALVGITRKRLAKLAEVDQTGLGRFLNGRYGAQPDTLKRIEQALAEELARNKKALAAEELAHVKEQQRELDRRRLELKRQLEEGCA